MLGGWGATGRHRADGGRLRPGHRHVEHPGRGGQPGSRCRSRHRRRGRQGLPGRRLCRHHLHGVQQGDGVRPAHRDVPAGAAYPHPVSWLSCGGIGAQVYCAGGVAADEYTDAWRYDPASDTWSALPNLPVELWGSQYASAGGMLVLAGGVTAGSIVGDQPDGRLRSGRRGLAEPAERPVQQVPGAAACGAYKIGGSPSSFVGSPDSERLGGLEGCSDASDLPWLSTAPTSFTLAAGASQTVTVTLTATAAAGVAQPGVHSG